MMGWINTCYPLSVLQFEKDLKRCSKLMEELDNVIAKKKDASQQVIRALQHSHVQSNRQLSDGS